MADETLSAGTVSLSVHPDTSRFSTLLKGALEGESGNWNIMGEKLGKKLVEGLGVALVGTAIEASKMAVDMSASNAKVAASAQISTQAATQIGDAFLHTAGQSTFSGQQMQSAFAPVAGVLQNLIGHTITQSDALNTMHVSTDLAEASGQDLATTTSDLTQVMVNFHIGLTGASDASNILFNTSRLTGISIDTLTSSVDKLHGKLGIAAPTLTDVSSLILDLSEHGIAGSRGLMIANTAMGTLLGGSKGTTAALKELGANVYDSSGKFVGMQSVLEQLTPKLAGMTEEQRHATEAALFGKAAASALDSTIMAGAAGLDKAREAVTAKNAVDVAAADQQKSYEGVIKMLTATYKDFMVLLGEKIIPIIKDVVTWFMNHKVIAEVLAGIIGGVLLAAMGAFIVSLFTAGGALAFLMSPVTLIIAGVALLVAGVIYAYHHFAIFKDIIKGVGDVIKDAIGFFTRLPGDILHALGNLGDLLLQAGKDIMGGLIHGIESLVTAPLDIVKKAASGILKGIKGFFGINSPSTVMAEVGSNLMQGLSNGITDNSDGTASAARRAMLKVSDTTKTLQDSINTSTQGDLLKQSQTAGNTISSVLTPVIQQLTTTLSNLVDAIRSVSGLSASSLISGSLDSAPSNVRSAALAKSSSMPALVVTGNSRMSENGGNGLPAPLLTYSGNQRMSENGGDNSGASNIPATGDDIMKLGQSFKQAMVETQRQARVMDRQGGL